MKKIALVMIMALMLVGVVSAWYPYHGPYYNENTHEQRYDFYERNTGVTYGHYSGCYGGCYYTAPYYHEYDTIVEDHHYEYNYNKWTRPYYW